MHIKYYSPATKRHTRMMNIKRKYGTAATTVLTILVAYGFTYILLVAGGAQY